MLNSSRNYPLVYWFIPVIFCVIYLRLFYTNYAYLDEIHQLWYNKDGSNFTMFHTQGRWITGILFNKFFASISTIGQIKLIRIFSFTGWIITAIIWSVILKKWVKLFSFNEEIWWLGTLYVICSISLSVYIGWASCFEVFLAILAGLAGGNVLFSKLQKQTGNIQLNGISIFLVVLSGIVSLFIYHTAFGIFLLPFFFHYLQSKKVKPDKIVWIGIVFYMLIHVIYYILFKYSLHIYDTDASTRTAIHFNILGKISFFFAGPLPQGFSLNFLFSARSIFSQVSYPVIIALWLFTFFKSNKHFSIAENIFRVAMLMLLLALIYLPLMIAAEDFPSYRTLFVFNLAVFIMVIDSFLSFFKVFRQRKIFVMALSVFLLVSGYYAFNFQYIIPLKEEYNVLRSFLKTNYKPSVTKVYFIRASKFMFTPVYYTSVYRDEFGAPSTYRDWVPIPITKQIVYELTGNRSVAEKLIVNQYENETLYKEQNITLDSASLLINMNELFYEKMKAE